MLASIAKRQRKREQHAGQRSMNSRMQHTEPHAHATHQVAPDCVHVFAVESTQNQEDRHGRRKVSERNGVRIEDCNHEYRPEIVGDCKRRQENLQRKGNPIAEKRKHPEGERDIGRHRNSCPTLRTRSIGERKMDRGGHDHAPDSGANRQQCVSKGTKFASVDLPLELQPNQQKENRHQSIVDPVFKGQAKHCMMQSMHIAFPQRRIGDRESN